MSRALEGLAAQVADMLFERGAVKFGAFTLKLHEKNPNAPKSPIYLNIRAEGHKDGTLRPEDFQLIAAFLMDRLDAEGLNFSHLAGIPVAGEPIAKALEVELQGSGWPIHVLHFNKVEGESSRQIGYFQEALLLRRGQDRIVLVDDLITKADTKLEAIKISLKSGFGVAALVVLVDREQGGAQQIRRQGHHIIIGFSISDLMAYYVETDKVEQAKADEVMTYIRKSRS